MELEKAVKEARRVIEAHFEGGDYTPKLEGKAGVFVTLTKNGRLRGCIGFPLPVELSTGLKEAALGAINDPRFPPLKKEELKEVRVEVSLLTPPERVENPLRSIVVGKHGIIVRRGFHSGLLLPQVAVEQGWNLEEFLDYGCIKAGLPPGCWKDAEVYRFEAKVCGEESHGQ